MFEISAAIRMQVVVFDSNGNSANSYGTTAAENSDDNENGAAFLMRILQYLETPQYLRKALFPRHNSLRFVVGNFHIKLEFFYLFSFFFLIWGELRIYIYKNIFFFLAILQGMLPPLDAPHHLRKHEWAPFREGLPFWFTKKFGLYLSPPCNALT